jgi:hypothetical protein
LNLTQTEKACHYGYHQGKRDPHPNPVDHHEGNPLHVTGHYPADYEPLQPEGSDINRTPDVRTRPIFPQWACRVTMTYVKDILTEQSIANLMGAAGMLIGIGDWRGERGGSYGKFTLVDEDNADFKAIVRHQGIKAQRAAFQTPIFYDEDTTELMNWFEEELLRREKSHLTKPTKPGNKERYVAHKNGGESHLEGKEPNV